MSDVTQAAPAGEAATSALEKPETLTVNAAAEILGRQIDPPAEAEAQPAQAAPSEPPQDAQDPPAETEPEQTAEPALDAEAPVDFETLHGNTKLRLRDGTEITVGQLKKRWGELEELPRAREQFEQHVQQFQTAAKSVSQREQLFQAAIPQAIALLQASLPQVPEPPARKLYDDDPFEYSKQVGEYQRAKFDYDQKVGQLHQLNAAQQQYAAQQQQETAARLSDVVKHEQAKLLEALPDLRDEAKRKEFYGDFIRYGKSEGFTEQELNGVYDHRMLKVIRKAAAYDKLQATAPKVIAQKAKAAAPMQEPGRRLASTEVKSKERQQLSQRLRQTGRFDDAVALIANLD